MPKIIFYLLAAVSASAQLQIHEVVYDGVGSDSDEVFTELTGPGGLLLDGWVLEGINGGTGTVYRSIPLDGIYLPPDGVLVLATALAEGEVLSARDATASVDWQNGPDAIRLLDPMGTITDALQYGDAGLFNSGEGASAPLTGAGQSLSRDSLGTNTQDNARDFAVSLPSPGSAVISLPPGATLSLPDTLGHPGELLSLPLRISDNELGLLAAEVAIIYDAQLLTPVTIDPSPTTLGWQVAAHVLQGDDWHDTLRVALATDTDTLIGDGALLQLSFLVADDPRPATAPLRLSDAVLDAGLRLPRVVDGSLRRIGIDAQLTADSSGFALPHRLAIQIQDPDEDRTANRDSVTVRISEGDTTESITLIEDGDRTGYFLGTIPLVHAPQLAADEVLQVLPRQKVDLCYTDSLSETGVTAELCVERSARGHDAELQASHTIEPGDTLWFRLSDVDLNRDSLAVEQATLTIRTNSDTLLHSLAAVDPAGSIYDGLLISSSTTTAGDTLRVLPGDSIFVSYLDTAAATDDLILRSDTTIVIRQFGDADGNALLQAFDANVILRHVVLPALTGADSLAANIDSLAPNSPISPVDASLLLQQRVGLRRRFPVQMRTSSNHPGPALDAVPAAERRGPVVRRLSLRPDGQDMLLWLDDRQGVFAVEAEISDLDAQDVMAAPPGYLAAYQRSGRRWHIALAGAIPLTGPGPLIRIRGVGPSTNAVLDRLIINDEVETLARDRTSSPVPDRWRVDASHPNPFNGSTRIPLHLPDPAHVEVVILNLLGQNVRRVADGHLSAGDHLLFWDGRDDGGDHLASGVYIVRARLAQTERRRRIMLLR